MANYTECKCWSVGDQDAELDEARRLRVPCSLPCSCSCSCSRPRCWNAHQRCCGGIPRHPPLAPVKTCSLIEKDLPSLSIVNVSEWVGRRRPLYKADKKASLNDYTCVSFSKQSKDSEIIKRVNLSFPGSISSLQTNQTKKMLNTIDINPLIGCSDLPQCPVVMWNPNPHHVPQALNQNKSHQVAIKELICPTFLKQAAEERMNRQVQRRQATLRQRFGHHKWRDQRCVKSTLEGAGTPQLNDDHWMPKITPHHLSCSLLFKDSRCGSLDQKLPSLTTTNPRHTSSLSSVLSSSLRSMKC